jgi:hypothetical protein
MPWRIHDISFLSIRFEKNIEEMTKIAFLEKWGTRTARKIMTD